MLQDSVRIGQFRGILILVSQFHFLHWATLLLAACTLGICTPSAFAADWQNHARRFTGESDLVRQNAITQLRKDPQLNQKLKSALGTVDHFLALDVISVLNLRSFLPTLSAFSEWDKTGYSYHVLNSIMTGQDLKKFAELYRSRLSLPKTAPASKIALMDSLGRMRVELAREELDPVLKHEDPEVRSAGIYYLRTALLKWRKYDYVPLIDRGLRDPAFQLRLQTLYLLSEVPRTVPPAVWMTVGKSLSACKEDPMKAVRSFCGTLQKRFSEVPSS